jgi:hypothetical protein
MVVPDRLDCESAIRPGVKRIVNGSSASRMWVNGQQVTGWPA